MIKSAATSSCPVLPMRCSVSTPVRPPPARAASRASASTSSLRPAASRSSRSWSTQKRKAAASKKAITSSHLPAARSRTPAKSSPRCKTWRSVPGCRWWCGVAKSASRWWRSFRRNSESSDAVSCACRPIAIAAPRNVSAFQIRPDHFHSILLFYDAIAQSAEAAHLALHYIACVQKLRRLTGEAHARRRAGGDYVAGFRGHAARQRRDGLGDGKDLVARVRGMLYHAVNPAAQVELLRIGAVVGGDDPRTHRAGAVQTLAEKVLLVAELEIARGQIVEHGVTEHVFERPLCGDAATAAADDHREFHFPVELRSERELDDDIGVVRGHAGHRLGEHHRMLRQLHRAAVRGQ